VAGRADLVAVGTDHAQPGSDLVAGFPGAPGGSARHGPLSAEVLAPILASVSAATVGAVLASRRPATPSAGCCWPSAYRRMPAAWPTLRGLRAAGPPRRAASRPLRGPSAAGHRAPALTCVGLVLLLTPTGSLPSPRWHWWAWITAAAPLVGGLAITLAPGPFDRPYQPTANPFDLVNLSGAPLVIYQLAFAIANLASLPAPTAL
jgi:hypothetical protein